MAAVWEDFLHYMDMKKFLKNLLLRNCQSEFGIKQLVRFEIISQDCSLGDPFQKLCEILIRRITWLSWEGDFLR